MAVPRFHLANAPIAEAIWDLRMQVSDRGRALKAIEELGATLRDLYPTQSGISQVAGAIYGDSGGGHGATSHAEPNGILVRSEKGTVAQLRPDGFTFSKLRPYTEWSEIVAETTDLWNRFASAVRPTCINRAALRYINDMALPAAPLDFYLTAPPSLPPGTTQLTREFLTRVVIWDQRRGVSTIITQAMGRQAAAESVRLLLDIDTFCEGDMKPTIEVLSPAMQKLHDIKNEVFFASLTEEAVRHFE